jgi:hypothetical protein
MGEEFTIRTGLYLLRSSPLYILSILLGSHPDNNRHAPFHYF